MSCGGETLAAKPQRGDRKKHPPSCSKVSSLGAKGQMTLVEMARRASTKPLSHYSAELTYRNKG